jgi:hypothetical protein
MRKLMALAIVLVFAGTTRSWAVLGLGNVTYDGSLEFSGISAKNELNKNDDAQADDRRGEVNTRLRVGIGADVTETVKARVELLRNDTRFGRQRSGSVVSGGPAASNSLDDEMNLIRVENAFLDFQNLYGLRAILGRQFVGNAGDLVWNLSPTDNDYLTSSAIDGLTLQYHKFEPVLVDLFLGKAIEDDTVANSSTTTNGDDTLGDTNLASLDIVFPTLIPGGKINAGYLWGVNESTVPTSNDNKLTTIRVGVRGGLMENMLNTKVTPSTSASALTAKRPRLVNSAWPSTS